MRLRTILTSLLLLTAGAASAAISTGYYRVVSYNGMYMTENTTDHTLVCSDLASNNYAQVWYLSVSGSNVTFKNVLTDKYIQGQGSYSSQYVTGTTQQTFTVVESDGKYAFQYDPYFGGGLHCDNNNTVVEWYTSENKSKWTIEAATVDEEALAAQKAAAAEATTTQLTTFFTTTACTELNSGYVAMSDANLRSAMSALPTTVQDLAIKVKNNAWTTYSGWDKTEINFRISSYQAYSKHDVWHNIIGCGYSLGRLTNPTGIYASAGEYLQVYVGAIPSGQTVKLEVAGEHQASGPTYTLKQGMNALLIASSGNCFINYEVDNTTDGKAPYTLIANYSPVTVHIEGGSVNGYFDLTKGDDNDDWAQLQAHLLKASPDVDLKTSNLMFHMNTSLVTAACPTNMAGLLGEWDKILDMEHSLLGLEAFDGYWNNLLSATDMTGDSYMHATTYGTFYNVSTISSVMSYGDMFAGGAIWGPAHENGHVFQKYINMVGQTEVSNNLFSNVAVYNNGHLTSRATNISTTFENMVNDVFWNDRGIWERTHLYFQLYQFFHILGNKSDFYPELFKALRSDPMVHSGGIFISATDDYLKFYKKCCSVSGYDLTEFFQAYGFFVIPTMTSYTLNDVTKNAYKVEDYANYYLTVTQAEIDAAKAEVAAMNLPKANIIFIEDHITAPDATYEGAVSGTKKTEFSYEYPIGQSGETGQYTTFGATCSNHTYSVSGTTVTMVGTGAVGFKVYDSTGKLRGLYNTYSFTLPDGIGSGYTIKAASGNGSDVEATSGASTETVTSDVTEVAGEATAAVVAGSQITAESQLVSGHLYLVYYVGNGASAYMKDTGSAYTGKSDDNPTQNAMYRFTDNGDGTWTVQNFATGKYWGTPTANANTYIGSDNAGAWALNFQSNQYIAPSCNDHSWNRSGSNIHPWSTGTANINQLMIREVTSSFDSPEDFTNKDIVVSDEAAATLQTGQWYVMFDRGTSPNAHGYLYENSETSTLYNTTTAPSGAATDNAKYLVRIVGWNNKYYVQTGLGNYFGSIQQSTNVPTTITATNQITLKKINNTNGHYYLMSATGVVLDANDLSLGDGTVVGWGNTPPTSLNGNNDWAFYPVEFVDASTESINLSDVAVIQGNETTGRGNTMQALLRIKVTPVRAATLTSMTATLTTGADQLDNVVVYITTDDELHAATAVPQQLGSATATSGSLTISLTANNALAANTTVYLWLTANVKSTAAELATIDAEVSSLTYNNDYTTGDITLDLTSIGNPDGVMRIYKQQTALWTPSHTNTTYYRIPTMINTADGGIVALADLRYNHPYDLGKNASNGTGSHKIDVVSRRSTDGGLTWQSEVTVAAGDGSTAAAYGYGDPAIVRDADGTLHCLMAAGSASYASGMLHMGYSKSTNNGASWSAVTDIYSSIDKGGLTIQSAFTTGGKGVTFSNGRMAFAFLGKVSGTTNIYPLYSDDKGATWHVQPTVAYGGGDESKLEIMNDNSLLLSVRKGSFNGTALRAHNRHRFMGLCF